jgi:hypothetical protein
MGFMKAPKAPPAAPPPPNPAITAIDAELEEEELGPATGSLIATAARGLKRRASVQRASLIGGG